MTTCNWTRAFVDELHKNYTKILSITLNLSLFNSNKKKVFSINGYNTTPTKTQRLQNLP